MAKEIHRVYQDLGKFLCQSTNRNDLRLFPILLECPTFDRVEEEWSREIVLDMARALLQLNEEDKPKFDILRAWWYQKPELFERIVRVFLKALQCRHGPDEYLNIAPEDLYLKTLHLLYEVKPFSLADYPFLLPVSIKWKIACEDFTTAQISKGRLRMCFIQGPAYFQPVPLPAPSNNRSEIDRENVVESAVGTVRFILRPVLVPVPDEIRFEIDRENVVESVFENVRTRARGEITEGLVVHFINDVALGVNGGGPMKELFQMFFDELLEPGKHTVFKRIGDPASSTTSWFNKDFHDLDMLKAIGKLFGLMIYNKVIITLPFPDLFYKKLVVDLVSSTEDLRLLEPDLAESIQSLSQLSEKDLKAMEMTFVKLFKWEEMKELFLGGEYDWMAFEESFRYEQGYTREHRVIKMFWEVFHSLQEEEKREFLRFFTGATHVPVGGFEVIGPRMWPMGEDNDCRGESPEDMCPEVNTCQNYVVLHLPMYKCKEDLEIRLRKVLDITTGFHKLPQPRPQIAPTPLSGGKQQPCSSEPRKQ
ncbi:uncharacterized protein [Diadema antillarum]|uniref:uncharacterized protein n=1 Tax=Diadema antillarum TaxID=105358 RepID=UPI003A846F79